MKKTNLSFTDDCPGMQVQTMSFRLFACESELSKMSARLRLGQPYS